MAIVRECTGHTCHSQHHVLWYFSRQPTTTVLLNIYILVRYSRKACFSKSRGGKFNRPVQGRGSTCRFGARSEGGQRVRSINRIASQSSHRYSRGGTTPLCYISLSLSLSYTHARTHSIRTAVFKYSITVRVDRKDEFSRFKIGSVGANNKYMMHAVNSSDRDNSKTR